MAEIRLKLLGRQEATRDGKPVYRETYLCLTLDGEQYKKDFFVPREDRTRESQLAQITD